MTMSTREEKETWLEGMLRGWGIREVWAKVLAGAILGAMTALGVLGSASCSAGSAAKAAYVHGVIHRITGTPCCMTPQK